eukprot:scaffold36023_cov24-Tisochrysis_lutea.AAC.5
MRELSSGTHSHRWCLLAPKPPTPSELPPGAHLHPHLIDLQLQSPEPSPGAHLLRHFIDLKPQSIEPRALLAPKNLRAISILTCLHQAFRATSRHTSRSICWSSLFPACVHGCTTCGRSMAGPQSIRALFLVHTRHIPCAHTSHQVGQCQDEHSTGGVVFLVMQACPLSHRLAS